MEEINSDLKVSLFYFVPNWNRNGFSGTGSTKRKVPLRAIETILALEFRERSNVACAIE
jgi:hypothetical protein